MTYTAYVMTDAGRVYFKSDQHCCVSCTGESSYRDTYIDDPCCCLHQQEFLNSNPWDVYSRMKALEAL